MAPEKRLINGYDFFCWSYEDQTEIKHKVLTDYIDRWIKILGNSYQLNYFDCFGGCGAYTKDGKNISFGSPIEVGKIIIQNFQSLQREVNLIVIEKDQCILDNLKKVFNYCDIGINPHFINGDFDVEINKTLDSLEKNNRQLAPTFFFVDPFGFKINMKTLQRIMENKKSEILLNFMFDYVNRFISDFAMEDNMYNLFGCKEWENVNTLTGFEREQFIIELYKQQIKKFAKYVYYYKMECPDKKRTYYYLVHITNHHMGCKIMKSSFAKINNGQLKFSGDRNNQLSFFNSDQFKFDELKHFFINNNFCGKAFSFDEIISKTIDKTPLLEKDIRKYLKQMEKERKIFIRRIESKKTGIKGRDRIVFHSNL